MLREIREKMQCLEERKPFRGEILQEIQGVHAIDWVYSCLHLGGSSVTKDMVGRIIGGQFVVEATVEDHRLVERLEDTMKEAVSLLEMDYDLDERVLERLSQKFYSDDRTGWRRGNPLNLEYNFTPVYSKDIPEEIRELFRWLYSDEVSPEIAGNSLLRASLLHTRFLEISPYDDYCEEMACIIMHYYLMQKGYPPFVLRFSREEYRQAVTAYLKKNDINLFYSCLERSLYNKLEVMMQITAESED